MFFAKKLKVEICRAANSRTKTYRAKRSAVHNCSSTSSHDKQRMARGNPNSCLMLPLKPNSLEQSQPLMQVAIIQLRDYLIDMCHISPVRALTSIIITSSNYFAIRINQKNFLCHLKRTNHWNTDSLKLNCHFTILDSAKSNANFIAMNPLRLPFITICWDFPL